MTEIKKRQASQRLAGASLTSFGVGIPFLPLSFGITYP